MARFFQLRQTKKLTPLAELLANYMVSHDILSYEMMAKHLGIHRNTIISWFRRDYLPNREHIDVLLAKLEDVPAEAIWRAIGVDTPPRPRAQPLWPSPAGEEDAFAAHIRRIERDPRLSSQSKEAMIAALRAAVGGQDRLRQHIIAEHVIESAPTPQSPARTRAADTADSAPIATVPQPES